MVNHIQEGYHTLTPYLFIRNAGQAIEFYKNVFGATELMRMPGPGGKIMHAEMQLGDSRMMLADENLEQGAKSPLAIGGTPVLLHIYVPDVDAVFAHSLKAGARALRQIEDKFYGDRSGAITDPFGHLWEISTHKEDLSPEEMRERMEKMKKS
jgi:PhnB protein